MSFLIGRAKESAGDDVAASDSDSHFGEREKERRRGCRVRVNCCLFLDEAGDDDDEPILSGTGQVDSSWTDDQLSSWSDLINKWDGHTRSKQLVQLVRKVIRKKRTFVCGRKIVSVFRAFLRSCEVKCGRCCATRRKA